MYTYLLASSAFSYALSRFSLAIKDLKSFVHCSSIIITSCKKNMLSGSFDTFSITHYQEILSFSYFKLNNFQQLPLKQYFYTCTYFTFHHTLVSFTGLVYFIYSSLQVFEQECPISRPEITFLIQSSTSLEVKLK